MRHTYCLLFVFLLVSCSKNSIDKEQISLRDSVQAPKAAGSSEASVQELGDTSDQPDAMPSAKDIPIGWLPLLHSSILAQFHPNPQGFYRYRSLAYDSNFVRTESVAFFKAKDDTTRILRCIITDQNEQTASTLIKQLIEVKAAGSREFEADGYKVVAYYTEINGIPALKLYDPKRKVATLNILCGDHRLVLFREDKAASADHLISVARTMDLKRLSEMVPE